MPSEEKGWHSLLEGALSKCEFGLPDGYELSWSPLPPFDDWMITVNSHGHAAAIVVTSHQMNLSTHIVDLLEANSAGRLIKILAIPAGKSVPDDVLERLTTGSIHLLRYGND